MSRVQRLKDTITELEFRVKELEEKLCPCESHKWKLINTDVDDYYWVRHKYTYTYKCEKCLKEKETCVKEIEDY